MFFVLTYVGREGESTNQNVYLGTLSKTGELFMLLFSFCRTTVTKLLNFAAMRAGCFLRFLYNLMPPICYLCFFRTFDKQRF
jgi:hypothetical protein